MAESEAVSYLRVSGLGQVDGDGFPRQREAIEQRARAAGLTIVAEFLDEGVSGCKPLAERPGLCALLDRIRGNGVRVVLVEKADRLARELVEGELILREFRRLGVRVIESEGGVELTLGDSGNPTATMIRQILGSVAEFERSALVAKLRAARMRIRKERGRCEGVRPLGELEGEQDVVAAIRRLRRRNPKSGRVRGYGEIAAELARLGLRTRHGRPWNRSTVRAVLVRAAAKGR